MLWILLAKHWRTSQWFLQITNTQMHKYSNAQIHKCTNTQMHQYTYAQIQKCTNTQMHKCTNTQIHKYTNTQIHKYTNSQILKWTNTQMHKYTNAQIHKCTNTQMQRALQNGRGDVEAPPRGTLMWQVCDFVRWVGAWQVWPIGGNSFQRCWAFCVFVYFLFVYLCISFLCICVLFAYLCIWQVEIAFRHVEPSHQVPL